MKETRRGALKRPTSQDRKDSAALAGESDIHTARKGQCPFGLYVGSAAATIVAVPAGAGVPAIAVAGIAAAAGAAGIAAAIAVSAAAPQQDDDQNDPQAAVITVVPHCFSPHSFVTGLSYVGGRQKAA